MPFLSPGVLPNLGIEPRSPALQIDSLPCEPGLYFSNAALFVGISYLDLLLGCCELTASRPCAWTLRNSVTGLTNSSNGANASAFPELSDSCQELSSSRRPHSLSSPLSSGWQSAILQPDRLRS